MNKTKFQHFPWSEIKNCINPWTGRSAVNADFNIGTRHLFLSDCLFYPHPFCRQLYIRSSAPIHSIGWLNRTGRVLQRRGKPQKFTVNLSHSQRAARNEHLAATDTSKQQKQDNSIPMVLCGIFYIFSSLSRNDKTNEPGTIEYYRPAAVPHCRVSSIHISMSVLHRRTLSSVS